jgi:hypothetical protein
MRVNVSSPYPLHIDVKHTFYSLDHEHLYQYAYYPKQETFQNTDTPRTRSTSRVGNATVS